MGAIGATPGGARQGNLKLTARDLKLTGPRPGARDSTDPHRPWWPGRLKQRLLCDYYETKHQTIIDYYETIAGILLELLGILLGILPDLLGFYWEYTGIDLGSY